MENLPEAQVWMGILVRLGFKHSVPFILAYLALAGASMLLAVAPSNVTPLYPAAGLAWGVAILWGRRTYPSIFVAATLANTLPLLFSQPSFTTVLAGIAIGVGEVISVLISCKLLSAVRGRERVFKQVQDVVAFSVIALFWVVSPTIGVSALALAGLVESEAFSRVWLTWWLGDSIGILLLTPLVLVLNTTHWRNLLNNDGYKLVVGIVGAATASLAVYVSELPLLYLLTGICFMAAYRLSLLGVIAVNLVIATITSSAYMWQVGPGAHFAAPIQLGLIQLFLAFNMVISLVFWCTQNRNRELSVKWSRAETQARLDPLTKIYNRRGFEERAIELMRQKRTLSLLILDIDHFKYVNDHYGHDIGDEVLRQFSKKIAGMIRDSDVFARIGGEEFAVILADQNLELAGLMAERIRATIESTELPVSSDNTIKYTVSIGVSSVSEGVDIHRWLKTTDKLLYQAKAQGRNQVAAGCVMPIDVAPTLSRKVN
ncbi:diguanylate cyclase [Saccharophagus degradans]|uniref:GGDEF domain-containing protein n=1 Tax=Saccharophagus degradans TaxID=86304 RepID=UPI002478296B|nr:diguanylate cyclase [Saccharophagus degradans]WGO98869.1 diguanylate cyclase [Saccharophagus degradans]